MGIILKCQCAQKAKSSRSPGLHRCHSLRSPHPLGASQPLCLRPSQLHPFPPRPQGQHVNPWPHWPSDTPHTPSWGWFTHPVSSLHGLLPGKSASLCLSPGTAGLFCRRGRAHLLPAHTAKLALYCFPSEVLHTRPNGLFLDLCTCPILFFKNCGKILIRLTIFKGPAQWYYVCSYWATITSIYLQNSSILQTETVPIKHELLVPLPQTLATTITHGTKHLCEFDYPQYHM